MKQLQNKKGIAGLNVFLSVITMIFVIGILIMAFALTGSEISSATTDATASAVMASTTITLANATDWFPIFIVIAAIVVIVLLIVLLIVALRGGGLMGAGGA